MFAVVDSRVHKWGCAACNYLYRIDGFCKYSMKKIDDLHRCPLGSEDPERAGDDPNSI
jgi:hypothetical protein